MVQGSLRNNDFEQLEGNGKSPIGGGKPSQEYNSCTFDKDRIFFFFYVGLDLLN